MNIEHVLGNPWAMCLRLALEAVAAGSLGIGAVIATQDGVPVSAGRNQLFDDSPSTNQLRDNRVSHAEINAIAGVPRRYANRKDLILYASVEPCPMCTGALVMSSIRDLRVAARDPWAGALHLLSQDPYMAGKHIRVVYEDGIVQRVFFHLHLLNLHIDASHPFFRCVEAAYPALYAQTMELRSDTAFMEALMQGDIDVVARRLAQDP